MTISQDRCVAVYPMDSWQVHLASMRQMRTTDARERQFVRMITAEAHPETLDRQGRITVPVRLRGYANLSKDVTVVGADTRIELWDSATWEPYREQGIADFAEINEAFNLGIL